MALLSDSSLLPVAVPCALMKRKANAAPCRSVLLYNTWTGTQHSLALITLPE